MLAYVHQFIINWLFTILVEIPVLVVIVRYFLKTSWEKIPLWRLILGGTFASTMTIPWVWFVFPVFFYRSIITAITIGEISALLIETIFYIFVFKFSLKQALVVSFVANLSSFLLGHILLHP